MNAQALVIIASNEILIKERELWTRESTICFAHIFPDGLSIHIMHRQEYSAYSLQKP